MSIGGRAWAGMVVKQLQKQRWQRSWGCINYCESAGDASSSLSRTLVTAAYSILRSSSSLNLKLNGDWHRNWSLCQRRGLKILGSDVRTGNILQRKGRIFQVLKAQHTQHGRGGASIQLELRDVDTGNKVTERFRTDEPIERVFVEEKCYQYLYTEGDIVVLTDSETFEQTEITKDLFGKAAVYLKEDMKVRVFYYDGRPMSATVPYRVTCTVVEAQAPMKGLSVNPQYKKVLLDNGLTVLAPPFILTGDAIVVNTADDAYITRVK